MLFRSSPDKSDDAGREFRVETNFQLKARKPGGVPRDKALTNASKNIERLKPSFEHWLDNEINELLRIIANTNPGADSDISWIDDAHTHSQNLADVGSTIDYQLLSFVSANLCRIFEAMKTGAPYNGGIIACHVDALRLARQQQYRWMRAEDLPELSDGLRRILESSQSGIQN